MPWNAQTIKKHNHSLGKTEAKGAARQANAILRETGNEGMALAVANKRINRLRNKGAISDRAHARMKST